MTNPAPRRFGIIHPLFLSFFSRALYRDVARNWQGLGLLYLLALLALSSLPEVLKVRSDFAEFLSAEAPKFIRQMPEVSIVKGTVSINKPSPYYIRDEKTGSTLMVIDTSGEISSLENTPGAVALLTKNALIVRQDGQGTRSIALSEIDRLFIDKRALYEWTEAIEDWFAVILYPFALLFSFIFHFLLVLMNSLVGMALSRRLSAALGFKALMRLASVSLTPALLPGAVSAIAGISLSYLWVAVLLISLSYLFFAIQACSADTADGSDQYQT